MVFGTLSRKRNNTLKKYTLAYLDTIHKRKSFTISTIIMAIILFLMFMVGMNYMDPPEEGGIAVNLSLIHI